MANCESGTRASTGTCSWAVKPALFKGVRATRDLHVKSDVKDASPMAAHRGMPCSAYAPHLRQQLLPDGLQLQGLLRELLQAWDDHSASKHACCGRRSHRAGDQQRHCWIDKPCKTGRGTSATWQLYKAPHTVLKAEHMCKPAFGTAPAVCLALEKMSDSKANRPTSLAVGTLSPIQAK